MQRPHRATWRTRRAAAAQRKLVGRELGPLGRPFREAVAAEREQLRLDERHGREHLPKLRDHAEIVDESDRLTEPPAAADIDV